MAMASTTTKIRKFFMIAKLLRRLQTKAIEFFRKEVGGEAEHHAEVRGNGRVCDWIPGGLAALLGATPVPNGVHPLRSWRSLPLPRPPGVPKVRRSLAWPSPGWRPGCRPQLATESQLFRATLACIQLASRDRYTPAPGRSDQ